MAYWLLKTEPDDCSIEDLAAQPLRCVLWEGVRNYQARNFLRQMQVGDEALIYHSSCQRIGVAGIARIARSAFPDPAQFVPESVYYDPKSAVEKPRWDAVELIFVSQFPRLLPLAQIKENPALQDLALVHRGNRLSVMPVTPAQWRAIVSAGGIPGCDFPN